MKRREFIKTASLLGSAPLAAWQAQSTSAGKPNIIFILADELGTGNVGCYGADNFKTPNIDQLARDGTRFTHCYTAPLCGPSSALILTGRYSFRTGVTSQDAAKQVEPAVETMMPRYLKAAGYVTASAGRWSPLPLTPEAFGFDEASNADGKGHSFDAMYGFLVDFITRHRDSPFYVYYSMSNLQKPILATPDSKPDSTDLYSDNISYMDKLVGKLVADLQRLKLRDNTLIVFSGDNGTGGVYADESTIGGRRLSGEKGSMLEGGALVPLIINWPGKTPAGRVSEDLVDSTDFVPTFAELAGVKLPDDKMIDGYSFAPRVQGRKAKSRDWVFIQLARDWYVREVAWKLNQAGQLFNMAKSPFEEPLISADTKDPEALAARQRLQSVLDKLNPAGGILDEGDGSGRRKGRIIHTKKQKKSK